MTFFALSTVKQEIQEYVPFWLLELNSCLTDTEHLNLFTKVSRNKIYRLLPVDCNNRIQQNVREKSIGRHAGQQAVRRCCTKE